MLNLIDANEVTQFSNNITITRDIIDHILFSYCVIKYHLVFCVHKRLFFEENFQILPKNPKSLQKMYSITYLFVSNQSVILYR